jgi:2-polyprenylphenol 6-hydroxylase
MRNVREWDAVVCGGGPVACVAALALQQQGLQVLLLGTEAKVEPLSAELDLRVYALAPDVLSFLQTLGVTLRTHPRSQRYEHMQVWTEARTAAKHLRFAAQDYGWPELGCIVEHRVLMHQLQQALQQSQVRALPGSAELQQDERGWRVEQRNDAQPDALNVYRARLVLAADGVNSRLRQQAGIEARTYVYPQRALIAHLRASDASAQAQHTAWQRFVDGGSLALLPLPESRFSMVWSTSIAHAEHLLQLSDEAFLAELKASADLPFHAWSELSERRSIELKRVLAERYVLPGFALIGDAAHAVHPLAGQGLNLGIRDVDCLCQQLQKQKPERALRAYERERKSENAISAYSLESLQKLFAVQQGPLVPLRAIGMRAVHEFVPLRRLLAELAAGKIAGWP